MPRGKEEKSPNKNNLLDEAEVAEHCNIATATLRNWRCLGTGPAYLKLGKRSVRYRREDVDAFIASGLIATGGDQ